MGCTVTTSARVFIILAVLRLAVRTLWLFGFLYEGSTVLLLRGFQKSAKFWYECIIVEMVLTWL